MSEIGRREGGKRVADGISQEQWQSILDAYRVYPSNHAKVAEVCGVNIRTARKSWETGYARLEYAKTPIKSIIAIEQGRARADRTSAERGALRDQLREAFESGLSDLIESRTKDGRIVKQAKGNAMAGLSASSMLLRGGLDLAEQIQQDIAQGAFDTPQKRIRACNAIARISKVSIESVLLVKELEDNVLGDYDTFASTVEHMSDEDALREIYEHVASIERSVKRGVYDVELVEKIKRDAFDVVPPDDLDEVERMRRADASRVEDEKNSHADP